MTLAKPPRGHSILPRRLLALVVAALLSIVLLPAAAAQADSSSSLSIVGTSDVSDSGLVPTLIGPEFEKAYPQFTFKYTGSATLAAINAAENGTGKPSMLIVHAASLENQFVAGGYSYNNQYGYAIFRNDFILAGPGADPAGVGGNAAHDIVQAFIDIATNGINSGGTPKATFISRGAAPGTVVAEHQIWQLIYTNNLEPAGLILCSVSSTQGGGMAPIASGHGVANGDPCPNSGANPDESLVPDWYVVTGVSQGPNVVYANSCTGTPILSGANSCYVFTDRGTYDYLQSGFDGGNGFATIGNLAILTRDNSASALGGQYALVNYFHAYIINPSAPCGGCEGVNTTAAQDFINFVTSPPIQAQISDYLAGGTGDSGGPPFQGDASPTVDAGFSPTAVSAGAHVTVSGSVTTNEIGYPALASVPVAVDEVVAGVDISVPGATATTDGNGDYTISFVPPASGSYQVTSGQVSQVEDNTLSPPFGDIQSPGASAATSVTVNSSIAIAAANLTTGGVVVAGTVSPAPLDGAGTVTLLARHGSTGSFSQVAAGGLTKGQSGYAVFAPLSGGLWEIEAVYSDPGQLAPSTSGVAFVAFPPAPPAHAVGFSKVTVRKGKVTVKGTLNPAPTATGAKVELLALREGKVKKSKAKKTVRAAAAGLHVVGKAKLGVGQTSYTIGARLTRGYQWVLELEYLQPGQTSVFSRLRTVAVH